MKAQILNKQSILAIHILNSSFDQSTYAADDARAAIDLLGAVHSEYAPEALAQLHCLAPEVLDSDVVAPLS